MRPGRNSKRSGNIRYLRHLAPNPVDHTIPDARNWSVKDVENYFFKYFGEGIAAAFSKLKVDGKLLMQIKKKQIFRAATKYRLIVWNQSKTNMESLNEIPTCIPNVIWMHIKCLQKRRPVFYLFSKRMMKESFTPWQIYILPGDFEYSGGPD